MTTVTVIGLTGSIGSGKSTVSKYLLKKGYIVIDSDLLSREVVQKGKPALKEIQAEFGKKVIAADGTLDRKKLASIVFSSKKKKEKLERIVTDRVVKEIKKTLRQLKKENIAETVFVDAPVLFECGADIPFDYIWVVVADDDVRAQRVMERDGCTYEEFLARTSAQLSQDDKMKRADRIIDNSGSKRKVYGRIRTLLKEINAL